MPETIRLPYGRDSLDLDLSRFPVRFTIIQSRQTTATEITIDDLHRSFADPIGTEPLSEIVRPGDTVCIVTSDGTRPFGPMRFMLHAVLDHLKLRPGQATVITGSGSHTPHTDAELRELFCAELLDRVTVISHDSRSADNVETGRLADGSRITMNRRYMDADRRIVLGHVEPHMFAGFTGGPKGIAPAICGIDTIHRLHSYDVIADPTSTYGDIEGNASTRIIREAAALAPPHFLVNVILNRYQKPVRVFSGHYLEAHRAAVATAHRWTGVSVPRRFPIVITSNSGHPLDQNLYQTVKGMDAALRLVQPGGIVIVASECLRGVPADSNFERLLASETSAEILLEKLSVLKGAVDDRWQVQKLMQIVQSCRIILVSSLDEQTTRRCKLTYAPTLDAALTTALASTPPAPDVAVLVDGPLTIPTVIADHVHPVR
jgi:nickel-dependent lactate racemase